MGHIVRNTHRAGLVGAFLLWVAAQVATAAAPTSTVVTLTAHPELAPTRVKVVLEVDGHLLAEPTPEEPSSADVATAKPHELKAKGQFLYEERIARERRGRSLRYFEQAEAELAIAAQPRQASLREDRRFIAVDTEAVPGESGLRSLQGPLSRQELDLLELPGGSHIINALLPDRDVKIGETWTHDDSLVAQLLNLTGVSVNEVSSELKEIDTEKQLAHVNLGGKILGYAAGVVTEIELQGKYNVDLRQQRVTWLALGIHEKRAAGSTKPGLDVQARLRMLIEPSPTPHLNQDTLKLITSSAPDPTFLLEYQPDHHRFTLLHDRRWHLFGELPEMTILRLVEDGQIVAQCNLRSLPRHASQRITLDQFQGEIRAALGAAAKQVVEATESTQPGEPRQLRVSIVGEVATAPIHWIYYQLSDDSGHVLTCVFTMSGQQVERFGSEDVTLVGGLTLNPPEPGDFKPAGQTEPTQEVASRASDSTP